MERRISQILDNYISGVYFPEIHITDIVEVLILAFLIYRVIIWIKNTKAWMLMKGILVLAGFIPRCFRCIRYSTLPKMLSRSWR